MSQPRTVIASVAILVCIWGLGAYANTPPAADFTAYRVRNAADAEILFDASASTDADGQIVNYQWVFGDGATGSGIQATHTYSSLRQVNVTLLAYDDGGSWHLVTKTIDLSLIALAPEGTQTAEADQPATETAETSPIPAQTTAPVGTTVGYKAPPFELPNADGSTTALAEFQGHVILLEFWKSTCGGCQASTPVLDAYSKNYTERGLVVILVVLDLHMTTAQQYMRSRGYTNFVLLHETLPYTSGTLLSYGVPGTPHAVLIDRTGEIRFVGHPSLLTGAQIEALL